jgi:hypothetical protein
MSEEVGCDLNQTVAIMPQRRYTLLDDRLTTLLRARNSGENFHIAGCGTIK